MDYRFHVALGSSRRGTLERVLAQGGERLMFIQLTLPLDHEPSLHHWAKCIADDDILTGYEKYWDYAYEQAWVYIDNELEREVN